MRDFLEAAWYGEAGGGWLLAPLGWLFGAGVALRRALFRRGLFPTTRVARPVVVVGNLTVGGTGKTPLVLWLAAELAKRGLRPGIISRGYGTEAGHARRVEPGAAASAGGDEPLLLARRSGLPVAVGRDRVATAALLAPETDLLISDDGLQHYALGRDLEIAVLDGVRGLGNGRLLPAGPLREARARLATVDFVVVNGVGGPSGALHMTLEPTALVRLADGHREPLAGWAGRQVHAVAGIGHPARFFATLRAAGLVPLEHAFADHARFAPGELDFPDQLPVLMTEKDAVKYEAFAGPRHWYLEVAARLPEADAVRLLDAVLALFQSRRTGLPTLE